MFQLSRFERVAPVSRFCSNLPFRDYPGLIVRSLWDFQVNHNFYKPDVKILAANDKFRFVRCSRQPTYHKQYFFVVSERNAKNKFENQHSL